MGIALVTQIGRDTLFTNERGTWTFSVDERDARLWMHLHCGVESHDLTIDTADLSRKQLAREVARFVLDVTNNAHKE